MKQLQTTPKRILILNTGGTIASKETSQGKTPGITAEELLDLLSAKQRAEITKDTSLFTKNLFGMGIDSSEMTPYHVQQIAICLKDEYDSYDSFVITHGTDTMAETATLLSFMIQQNSKSIVLTGSQRTPSEKNSDAPNNLYCALLQAKKELGGVVLSFGQNTFAGYSVKKIHTTKDAAFAGVLPTKVISSKTIFATHYCDRVDTMTITTSTQPELIDYYFEHNDALIVQLFGLGGTNKQISEKLIEWANKGKKIIAKTKCSQGITDLTEYEVGLRLSQEGILSALDMSVEAAQAKVQWLLGARNTQQSFKNLWYSDFIGEMPLAIVKEYLMKEQAKTLKLITQTHSNVKEKYLYNYKQFEVV